MRNIDKCLLIIWLDALRSSYINERDTPFLSKISQESLFGVYRPTMAYVGIGMSIFTGVKASTHGAWTEFRYNPDRSPFGWTSGVMPLLALSDLVTQHSGRVGHYGRAALNKVIFLVSNRLSGRTYVPIGKQVPSSRLHYFDVSIMHNEISHKDASVTPTLFDILRSQSITFRSLEESSHGDETIFRKALLVDRKARVVFIQFSELDRVGHEHGPNSVEIKAALHRIDKRMRQLFEAYQSFFELEVFILSDHGMIEVEETIDVQGALHRYGLKEGSDFIACYDSTIARFWSLRVPLQVIERYVRSIKGGEILPTMRLENLGVPHDRAYGDLVWLANPGNIILPNYYQGLKHVKGMHGYFPGSSGLEAPYIIYSRNIPQGKAERIANPVDILPTILSILNIDIPDYVEGKSLLSE